MMRNMLLFVLVLYFLLKHGYSETGKTEINI